MSAGSAEARPLQGSAPDEAPAGAGDAKGAAPAPRVAEIVVGVVPTPGAHPSAFAHELELELRRSFPGRSAEVVALEPGMAADGTRITVKRGPGTPPAVFTGGFLGPESVLPSLLERAQALDARACAVVGQRPPRAGTDWLRLLLAPVVDGGFDFVCPAYRRHKLDGAINNGIVYPLTRALFGKRLRQPLGGELAISRRLADQLLADAEWRTDPVRAGADMWLVTKVLTRGLRTCQAFLGARPEGPVARDGDVSEALARIVGLLFHEMERHAGVWQRIGGSEPVPTFGDPSLLEDESSAPAGRMVEAFELAYRDLRPVWGMLIPPGDLLALKRVSGQPPESFRLDDALWARLVYDFALAFHAGVAPEGQLLRALTPLYLAWLASFINQARLASGAEVEAQVERLCVAFEGQKGYLISGWRWPDRFNP